MILINKVTPFASETFQNDLIECISHNININSITSIIVFHNNSNIILPNHDKVKLIVKNRYTDKDIIEYCKKITTDDIFIFSNPFIKFNNTLDNLQKPLDSINKIGNDCFIFNRNEKIVETDIDNIFEETKQNNKILVDRKHIWTDEIKKFNTNKRVELISNNEVKINAIIVSVDYNDFLSITLESVSNLMDVTVVTSPEDTTCQQLCEKFKVNCVVTDKMYDDDAKFNKGKAINEGLKSIEDPNWILLLDADIYLQSDFLDVLKSTNLTLEDLYICRRLILDRYDMFTKWKNGESVGQLERCKGYGFLHLFNFKANNKLKFPENYKDASFSDLEFRDKFKNKKELNTYVVHLGETNKNWSGRITKEFTKEFDINSYFDKIYCLNLEKREDRWLKVNKEFTKNSINVTRFKAISEDMISDTEFNSLKNKYNVNNLSNIELSLYGLIENKKSLACLNTHLKIIKDAKLNKYKRILIFEDDVLISNDFKERISTIESLDWEILYLGASQFNWNNIEVENNFYKSKSTLGTFAYCLSDSIYDELISLIGSRKRSIDNLLTEIQLKTKSYTIYPNIVISDVSTSDIRDSKDITSYSDMVKWDLSKFNIKSKSVSMIIPCYNQSKFLEECVDSCLSQSVLPDEIIILLMDDESISMKNSIESKSKIIKCFISEKINLSSARNLCVEKSNCDYFIPLDADDKIPNNFIEEVLNIEDSDVVYVGSKYFGSIEGTWPNPITEEINWTKLTTFRRNSLVCTALINKQSFIDSGRYNDDLWAFEDMDLWIKMYQNNKKFNKCFNTYLLYRKHQSESLLKEANSKEENKNYLKKIIMNNKYYSKVPKIIHYVWVGENPIPNEIIETWKRNLPEGEWTYMLWNEKNFDMNSSDFLKKSYDLKKYGICVDYIRAKVLYEYGGVWLDADCVINNDISSFLQYDFFASWENEKYLNIGLIGCKPKLEQMENILDFYSNLKIESEVLNNQILFVNKVGTGPIVLTNEILKICDIRNGGFTKEFTHGENRFLIETPDVFVLDDSISGRINYAVHLFDGSWTEKKEKWADVVNNYYKNWKIKNKI